MNNSFQINKVYSNDSLSFNYGNDITEKPRFYSSLYEDNIEKCPWPMAHKMYENFSNIYASPFTYYVPVKRTKCFLYIRCNGKQISKLKIRCNNRGEEYIIINNIELFASEINDINIDTAETQFNIEHNIRRHLLYYIEKLQHLEEYGYVYVDNQIKIDTINELDNWYKNNNAK